MGDKHRVHFEPVDLEMEVDEDETVLDAAFRQGISLMHGCREGQCSACKSFLLDGDVQMARYSTFALADYESEEGYVLLCKTHAYSDLTVELINFDEEELHDAVPIQTVRTTIAALVPLTGDIVSLRLKLAEGERFVHKAGQYSEIRLPDSDVKRSFSMATTPSSTEESGEIEFIIKKYPGGHFSGLLDSTLAPGDEVVLTGPYGSCTLRASSDRRIVCIAGGAGMAPILSLLRRLAESGTERPVVFYYGARTAEDLFYLPEIVSLGLKIKDFRFVPALSHGPEADWATLGVTGDLGLITDVVDRQEPDLTETDCYLCGPPPMVDAAIALLESRDVPGERIHFDKFTTSVSES
ncbi:2Fe-2S iron-sulfur cluster binding domain-containing protein [Kineosporia rhizophila]|uniref:2Fe-2S iron-sulfur cluster-binding protein n=1 Tax=Kineosporia rhizophila TaxID=84633 RepID=UPI001E52864E|nr:2Fe-2S iron-sulfur cluster binding domain-containing protein [Kineosporia rhizophila]MCE0535706.1 2Fe-2S iron-sulfur cluster binding domain-containing protein [Kineosporia rhizophila]